METESLIVKDQIEINASKEKVWEVLINPNFIKQWDDIPENYTGGHLKLNSVIEWEGYSKLTIVEFDSFNKLTMKMFLPKVNLDESEYDVSYKFILSGDSSTVLKFEIGDFSFLPNSQDYFESTKEWIITARKKIKELAESL